MHKKLDKYKEIVIGIQDTQKMFNWWKGSRRVRLEMNTPCKNSLKVSRIKKMSYYGCEVSSEIIKKKKNKIFTEKELQKYSHQHFRKMSHDKDKRKKRKEKL